jgi:hypothetical protein
MLLAPDWFDKFHFAVIFNISGGFLGKAAMAVAYQLMGNPSVGNKFNHYITKFYHGMVSLSYQHFHKAFS